MEDEIRRIKDKYAQELLKIKGVVGVGIGKKVVSGKEGDQLAIVVFVTKKLPKSLLKKSDVIPDSLEGIPVDVQEVGLVRALKTEEGSKTCLTPKS